jgi:thymidylate synthase ThyX
MISASIIADSVYYGDRIISIKTVAPKFLDAEVEKHRMISSNSSSDRAIPTARMLEQEPFLPKDVRLNQPGMQGYEQTYDLEEFHGALKDLYDHTAEVIKRFSYIHKQHLNRYLLPFSWQTKLLTANEEQFKYFIFLRKSEHADPAIQELATKVEKAIANSKPKLLDPGQWHLPFVQEEEERDTSEAIKLSVARCARISYNNHDKSEPNILLDIKLHDRLLADRHMSCFEHQATPMGFLPKGLTHTDTRRRRWSGNFRGWVQYRQLVNMWNKYGGMEII